LEIWPGFSLGMQTISPTMKGRKVGAVVDWFLSSPRGEDAVFGFRYCSGSPGSFADSQYQLYSYWNVNDVVNLEPSEISILSRPYEVNFSDR